MGAQKAENAVSSGEMKEEYHLRLPNPDTRCGTCQNDVERARELHTQLSVQSFGTRDDELVTHDNDVTGQ